MSIKQEIEKLVSMAAEIEAKFEDIKELERAKGSLVKRLNEYGIFAIDFDFSRTKVLLKDCALHQLNQEFIKHELDRYKKDFRQAFLGTKE